MLAHVGMTRLDSIIATDFYHPTFKAWGENPVSTSEACRCTELAGAEFAVDFIGPWKIRVTGCKSD